ncbi:MAG: peptidoglycan DD-metalloendopeptidase family protein [Prevotellaceae bacterium]|jgi:septal ring factor EnvC (AmiA/AmiB activator)|nr:peptidoglycan DD-metalloendopeptidase family protein [Prevotellaceae bacterium]
MKKHIAFILTLPFLLCAAPLAVGQDVVKDLEQQKKQLESDIAYTKTLIDKTKQAQKTNLDNLNLIQVNITSRRSFINHIDKQLVILSTEIAEKQKKVANLYSDLAQLKENYARMLNFAYRNQAVHHQLMYVFASDDLNQAYRRMTYLKAYSEHRVRQAKNIVLQSENLNKELEALRQKKQEQEYLLNQKTVELVALDVEEKQYQAVVQSLRRRESELMRDLEAKKKQAVMLNKQIESAIAEETRREEQRRREAEKKGKETAQKKATTDQATTDKFEKLYGKLPMPVAKGVLVTRFGIYEHPVLKGIKVTSNGIDISTNEGAAVSVVADGVVRKIFITGSVTSVLVQHGLYYTVYTHLKAVSARSGDAVKARQRIGLVAASDDDRAILHFELWKQTVKQDPERWLVDR